MNERLVEEAHLLMRDKLPTKILLLSKLLQEELFDPQNHHCCNSATPEPLQEVPTNGFIQKQIDTLRPLAIEMLTELNSIGVGMQILQQKAENGTNFAFESLMIEMMKQIVISQSSLQNCFDTIKDFHEIRGVTIEMVLESRKMEDARLLASELDERYRRSLCDGLVALRFHYLNMHDFYVKNGEKMKKPRDEDKSREFLF